MTQWSAITSSLKGVDRGGGTFALYTSVILGIVYLLGTKQMCLNQMDDVHGANPLNTTVFNPKDLVFLHSDVPPASKKARLISQKGELHPGLSFASPSYTFDGG